MKEAYNRLAEPFRRFIYRKRWDGLTQLQKQAIEAVLNSKDSLVISAGTASGKTEAALFPVLSDIYENPQPGVRVLYISPLKALINDQYRRITEMTSDAEIANDTGIANDIGITNNTGINVLRYHSDVGEQKKKGLRQQENLLVMLTPESLESLLAHERSMLEERMRNLQYIIIDEMHYFMESERGIQLLCVLARLQQLIQRIPRRIGLSATIGSAESASRWLASDTGIPCRVLTDAVSTSGERKAESHPAAQDGVLPSVGHVPPGVGHIPPGGGSMPHRQYRLMISGYENPAEKVNILSGLVKGKRSLIFFPTKKDLEDTARLLEPVQPVYMHHAGLSAELRHDTEEQLRRNVRPVTVASTTTLELGIDIGSLERIVQIGVPMRVASMVQRLGRSGRRGKPSEMAFAVDLEADGMHWELLQAIAIIRLYTEDHWMETPQMLKKPFHVMLQQMLAVLRSDGPQTAQALQEQILGMEAFREIEPMEYALLYQHMLTEDLIEIAEDGTLMLGLKGEFIAGSREFYTVFQASEEYQVFYREQRLGCCSSKPQIGDVIAMAGASWKVQHIDGSAREVVVEKSSEVGRDAGGSGQDSMIDYRIAAMMLDILEDTRIYPWMTGAAQKALQEDRNLYKTVPDSQKRITVGPGVKSSSFKYASMLPQHLVELETASGSEQECSYIQQIQDWKRRWIHGTE